MPWSLASASVLLVTVDALRADALPPVRDGTRAHAQPGDTPVLDAFVAESFAFTHAVAPATFTFGALPAMFASTTAHEGAVAGTAWLPEAMRDSGRTTFAVVDRFFEGSAERRAILVGFDHVDTHATADMHTAVDQTIARLDQTGRRPFFGWLHLLATHAPGYSGRRLVSESDGTANERYRKSLVWVDGEIGRLLHAIDARELADETIVILTSDHGEALGDHGLFGHGASVFDAEVRVPLAIRISGARGRVIDPVVGTIDLLPTLLELLGRADDGGCVGRSLVPLMTGADVEWSRSMHTMSLARTFAVSRGRDKLVFDSGSGVMLRFDLASDPGEEHDLMGTDPTKESELARELFAD
jgi:arylsulfatase A-like enzyme